MPAKRVVQAVDGGDSALEEPVDARSAGHRNAPQKTRQGTAARWPRPQPGGKIGKTGGLERRIKVERLPAPRGRQHDAVDETDQTCLAEPVLPPARSRPRPGVCGENDRFARTTGYGLYSQFTGVNL